MRSTLNIKSAEQIPGLEEMARNELANSGGFGICVEIRRGSKRRSNSQNRLLWKILGCISEQVEIGGRRYPPEIWHEQFKREFLGSVDLPGGGSMGESTANLSSSEFCDYVSKVESKACNELGVKIIFDY